MDVSQIIQNGWVTRKELRYTVRPSAKVKERPVKDIMQVTFWAGVQGQGRTLKIHQFVAVWPMLGDYLEKIPYLQHMRNPQTKPKVSIRHEPVVIEAVLNKIDMIEPE
jgi:hypothetical protein